MVFVAGRGMMLPLLLVVLLLPEPSVSRNGNCNCGVFPVGRNRSAVFTARPCCDVSCKGASNEHCRVLCYQFAKTMMLDNREDMCKRVVNAEGRKFLGLYRTCEHRRWLLAGFVPQHTLCCRAGRTLECDATPNTEAADEDPHHLKMELMEGQPNKLDTELGEGQPYPLDMELANGLPYHLDTDMADEQSFKLHTEPVDGQLYDNDVGYVPVFHSKEEHIQLNSRLHEQSTELAHPIN